MSLVSASRNTHNTLYNEAVVFEGHEGAVLSCSFAPDGDSLATGGLDRAILLWTLPTEESVHHNYAELRGHKSGVTSLCWDSPNLLFSTSADHTVAFWDVETGQKIRKGTSHTLTVNDSAVVSLELCISVADDGKLCLWDARQKGPVHTQSTTYPLLSVEADLNNFFVGGLDGRVSAFDARKFEELWSENLPDSVVSVCLRSDKSTLVAKTMSGSISTLSCSGVSRDVRTFTGLNNSAQWLSRVSVSHNGVFIAGGCENELVVWGSEGRMVHRYDGHSSPVIGVQFHPIQNIIMSTGADGKVILRQY